MKSRHLTLALTTLLLLATLPARAQTPMKVATVDIQELFKKHHQTTEAQQQINVDRARIQKQGNERTDRIRALENELGELKKQLDNPAINENKKKGLSGEMQAKIQEGMALDKERKEFLERSNNAINQKMVAQMKAILEDIRAQVEKRAKSDGYNLVVDKSGLSTSQTPFVIYSDITDLTAEILVELNKDAPADKEKPETPPPAP